MQAQAYVWSLYDPDRSKTPAERKGGALVDATYEDFDAALQAIVKAHAADLGAGLEILTPTTNSPSFNRMRAKVLAKLPKATFHTYSSVNDDNARQGAAIAFGKPINVVPNFGAAKVVVSLDSDFLGSEPGAVRAARGFAKNRALATPDGQMSRLYVVESNHTVTGSSADHRLRLGATDVGRYAAALAQALQKKVGGLGSAAGGLSVDSNGIPARWIEAVAADLAANKGASIVVAGSAQPPHVHALAHAMNAALGNQGRTLKYAKASGSKADSSSKGIASFAAGLGKAKTALILGGNPAYDAPADLNLGAALAREGLTTVHLASHRDETSNLCSWHVPEAHGLAAWGDHLSTDGTLSIQQPLIAPLYNGRSAIEILAVLASEETTNGHDIVCDTHRSGVFGATGFDRGWRNALYLGVAKAGAALEAPGLQPAAIAQSYKRALSTKEAGTALSKTNLEVKFAPDLALDDGRYANNIWALELADPVTKIVWDNAALISISTRNAFGLKNGQMVRLKRGDRTLEVPVWAVPGHADWSVTLYLGWGRKDAGHYGNGQGFDAQALRTTDAFNLGKGVTLEPLNSTYRIVQTQEHDRMEGRPIAIDATLDEYKKEPEFASYRTVEFSSTPPLWKEVDYSEGHKWGMTIDLSSCTGCNSCVVACQAENNIPVVGKREVERGREMAWIRIDCYFVGDDDDNPEVALQPVACQQCEEAPCENVCPVNATVHSPEGLNEMTYNRCIGTRYCANNCPYKVRRFNYFDWHGFLDNKWKMYGGFPESKKLQFNPNVTVRMRGVMEKCTYCVQRIQSAKIAAKREDRKLKDGDIVTTCQSACPSGSIVFGDLNDPKSRVTKLNKLDRRYKLLAEVGTQPRTTYLAKIRNPNHDMDGKG